MATSDEPLPERAAENESRFRNFNERIEVYNRANDWVDPGIPEWRCECAGKTCLKAVELTLAEYEAVRSDPTHFLVAPAEEHVVPGVERVVERHERYWVVEKVGAAGDLSEQLDPRTSDGR
jgi:hypothetical protein